MTAKMTAMALCVLVLAAVLSSVLGQRTIETGVVTTTYTIDIAAGTMTFEMSAATTGYVSIGFCPMPCNYHGGADYWTGSVDGNGDLTLLDTYSTSRNQPTQDGSDDLTAIASDETGGTTTISFSRALDTGDAAQDHAILDQMVLFQWAIGGADIANGNYDKHNNAGTLVTNLVGFVPVTGSSTYTAPGTGFEMSYGKSDDNTMQFILKAPTTGWIGVGWSTQGGNHVATDMIVGWCDAAGTVTIYDTYSDAQDRPTLDATQDITNAECVEVNGATSIVFYRALATGDASDIPITDADLNVQWAYAGADGTNENDYPQHNQASVTTLNLLATGGIGGGSLEDETAGLFESPLGDFKLYYTIDGEYIEWTMEATTTGYVSFGFYGADGTAHAGDMIVGWYDAAAGTGVLADTYATAPPKQMPQGDTRPSDLELVTASEVAGTTSITVRRLLTTGDAQDQDVVDGEVTLMWAYGVTDGTATPFSVAKHSATGVGSVNFYSAAAVAGGTGLDFTLDAGLGLVYSVGGFFALWAIIRWSRKCWKCCTKGSGGSSTGADEDDWGASDNVSGRGIGHYRATMMVPSNGGGGGMDWGWGATDDEWGGQNQDTAAGYAAYDDGGWGGGWGNDDGGGWDNGDSWGGGAQGQWGPVGPEGPYGDDGWGNDGGGVSFAPAVSFAEPSSGQFGDRWGDGDYEMDKAGGGGGGGHTWATAEPTVTSKGSRARPKTMTAAKAETGGCKNCIASCKNRRVCCSSATYLDVTISIIYVALNVVWVYFVDKTWDPVLSWGYVAAANSLFVSLPASRNSLLIWIFGLPYDHTIKYHRYLGRWTLITVLIHMFGYWARWAATPDGIGTQFAEVKYMMGFWSALGCLLIFIMSINYCRRSWHNVFIVSHYILFSVFYVFALLHSTKVRWYVLVTAGIYALDRLIRFLVGMCPRKTIRFEALADDVVRVQFHKRSFAKYRVGHYVFLNWLGTDVMEWHPYTLSSSPHEDYLEVHIKGLGDHTNKLVAKAQSGATLRPYLRVDGPFGRPSLNYRRYETLILVAGGIGITPAISMLKAIYDINIGKKGKATAGHAKHVFLVWAIPTESSYTWFSEVLEACQQAADSNAGFPLLTQFVHVTRQDYVDNPSLYAGRPNMGQVFDAAKAQANITRGAVFSCGPEKLVSAARDESVKNTSGSVRFDFHEEVFAV